MSSAPFKVKAIYEYGSPEPDDLSFPAGQIITVTEEVDADWYEGEYTDGSGAKKSGIFPNNFVEKYEPEIPTRPSRPARPKQEAQSAGPPAPVAAAQEKEEKDDVKEDAAQVPSVSTASKPSTAPAASSKPPEETRSPAFTSQAQATPASVKPSPVASKPSESKKPPPVAPKTNAFKDRIAAFNQGAAAPIMPFQPGQRSQQPSGFIKKPFVAPPPSKDSYVPPPKQETVNVPYVREEDPEIQQRQEDDRTAAEAAGLTREEPAEEDADAPKPQSLKDRIAMLQKQQIEQAQRRSDTGHKKEKKAVEDEEEDLQRVRSPEAAERRSVDVHREHPRIPSAQTRPQEPLSPIPVAPEHEILSGGEEADQSAAGETTEDDADTIGPEDSDERPLPIPRAAAVPIREPDVGDEEDTTEDRESEDEEDEVDEETRRKLELRERMAKMSGGMGLAGMFGAPGGMTVPGAGVAKKRTPNKERRVTEDSVSSTSPPIPQQRIPMIPMPAMQRVQSPDSDQTQRVVEHEDEHGGVGLISGERPADEVPDVEDVKREPPPRASFTRERGAPPPLPKERPISQSRDRPVPPPPDSRPVPPPPPSGAPIPPTPGSESDDEASMYAHGSVGATPSAETPLPLRGAPPPLPRTAQNLQENRSSYFGSEGSISATPPADRRSSRVPPIPGITDAVTSPRPPPPPPPPTAAPPSRAGTENLGPVAGDERGESEYEGDYDTDIASSAKHKDALRPHAREASLDESTTADETPLSSPLATNAPRIPLPAMTQRAAPPPPPPPQVNSKASRQSGETPRAPPPMPPTRGMSGAAAEDDYDPYRYVEQTRPPPPVPNAVPIAAPPIPPRESEADNEESSDDMYSAPPPRKSVERPPPQPPTSSAPQDRAPPLPPNLQAPPPHRSAPRQSQDVPRGGPQVRRSLEQQGRPSGDQGHIATDLDLSEESQWWTATQPLPPVLASRNGVDLLSESEESTTSKRGGRTTISKDIYILFIDYSQTVITARYDSREPSDVSLEQRHEPPPAKLRQDQLESLWHRFGAKIAETASQIGNSKKESSVGDGSSASLVFELIKAQPEALRPVGTRAYGALVYANLANASVMQFDEMRPGDVVTLRNAKFEGKHSGPMHQKYKQETGPSHVALVQEWDGTKKKVRVWEQGREKKGGLKSESFRLGDLKSGEVRVWRVVGREWVGWDGNA